MVANAEATAFAPAARPQVAIAADGSLAAIHEPSRVVVVEVSTCSPFAELGIDGDSSSSDVAWVGTPPRLIVLSRYSAHSMVHLVDPFGPRTIAEMRLEAPMKLYTSVGNHALVMGSLGAAVLAATDTSLTLYQFPARARPVTAGSAGGHFMVALSSAIEEWDPQNRIPKRRLKLPRPALITAVGGSDRVVWMTTQQEPARIDVIPLVNRGQPKAHDLPEPIASISSHPRSDLVVCVGATSGRVWVIDLDGRTGLRMIGPEGIDRADAAGLVLGRMTGVLAAQAHRPIIVIGLDRNDDAAPRKVAGREGSAPTPIARERTGPAEVQGERSGPASSPPQLAEPKRSTLYEDDVVEEVATSVTLSSSSPLAEPEPFSWSADAASTERKSEPDLAPEEPPSVPERVSWRPAPDLATKAIPRLAHRHARPAIADVQIVAWRERMRHPRARTVEQPAQYWPAAPATWRDDALAWARSVVGGEPDADVSADSPFATLVSRYEVSVALQPVLALIYGLHLAGVDGAAPAEIARIRGTWDDALGRGELAQRCITTYRDSRVRLAPAVMRALDELPPTTGTLVGSPGVCSLLGPCAIVAAGPLAIVAEACGSSIGGAILAAFDGVDPAELVREARAYGAAPMLRVVPSELERVPTHEPIILVVDDDATADQLEIPRLT